MPEENAPLLVVGAGVLLQHNTVRVLDALGVGEGLAAAARGG
ncbi:hypothetical protein [Streptomyces xanthophaeus]